MTKEQFAVWLQGYLNVNIFNSMSRGSGVIGVEVQKMGDDVLEAAHSVGACARQKCHCGKYTLQVNYDGSHVPFADGNIVHELSKCVERTSK